MSTTTHVNTTATAPATRLDPAWGAWSAAWTRHITTLTGRQDLTVTVAPGAGGGAPACFYPNLAAVEVDATHIGDPHIADPRRPGHKKKVPAAWGLLVHESAHAVHSQWQAPPDTPPILAEVADLLEECRAEHQQRRRRPYDRQWLRHAAHTLITVDQAASDHPWHAATAAGLLLARVDARVLTPADVRPVRQAVTTVLGRKKLAALRRIWRAAHGCADTDATTMIDLARRWCRILDLDPDTTPQCPNPAADAASRVAAGVTAVLAALNPANQPPPPPPPPAPTDPAAGTNPIPRAWQPRPPRPDEHAAARRLALRLRAAAAREPVTTRHTAPTPPGRLRTRAAMTAAAQRAAGQLPTAQPWQQTRRRPSPDPQLALAVLVDVSGSMKPFAAPLSSAAWILAHAAVRIGATTATLAFGDGVTILVAPGQRPGHVREMTAESGSDGFDQAVHVADRLLGLTTPGTVRLLAVVSDGDFPDIDRHQAAVDTLLHAGCPVLWLHPAGLSCHTYPGATTITVDDPARCVDLIARAAATALAHA